MLFASSLFGLSCTKFVLFIFLRQQGYELIAPDFSYNITSTLIRKLPKENQTSVWSVLPILTLVHLNCSYWTIIHVCFKDTSCSESYLSITVLRKESTSSAGRIYWAAWRKRMGESTLKLFCRPISGKLISGSCMHITLSGTLFNCWQCFQLLKDSIWAGGTNISLIITDSQVVNIVSVT